MNGSLMPDVREKQGKERRKKGDRERALYAFPISVLYIFLEFQSIFGCFAVKAQLGIALLMFSNRYAGWGSPLIDSSQQVST